MGLFGSKPQQQRGRPPTKEAVSGSLHAVPCPHCMQPNDFRGLQPVGDNAGWGSYGLEAGTVVECDHCGKRMVITGVQNVTVVAVRQAGTV